MNATTMQPTSLKALAARVRLCNSLCNSNATMQPTMQKGMQLSMQLSPENDPKVALKVAVVSGVEIQKMSLSEFKNSGLIVKVFSEVLQDHVYFSSDTVINRCSPLDAVSYTAQELQAMLDMEPEEVKAAHEVKTLFHRARVIEHRRVTA
ncbi:MAG: hypothetical protein Q7T53_09700 [Deltaproteobacteria bacterium]|nr:hypothetical protein [Deltaproteobacteria bacterium]